jgi:hypothetical protein
MRRADDRRGRRYRRELRTRFDLPRQEIDHVLYGTTIVTNAVPEHGAAVTGTVWRSVGRAGV